MASPPEPLEDILAEKWDKEMDKSGRNTEQAAVPNPNEEPSSPGNPNVEAECIMGSGGMPPKVHLSEKLEIVYSRSLGAFDTLNVETTAAFDSEEEDTLTSLQSHDSYTAGSVDSATIASMLSSDAKLVRVEDNVMSLLKHIQCSQMDTVTDEFVNMEEGLKTNLENIEKSLKCGRINDVVHDELVSDEDSFTLNSVGSPFSGSAAARSARSASSHSASGASANSGSLGDDSAEVEALVEELEENGIYPKASSPRMHVHPTLEAAAKPPKFKARSPPALGAAIKPPKFKVAETSVEVSSPPDKRSKGSAWFKKLAQRPVTPRSLTSRPSTPPSTKKSQNGKRAASPALSHMSSPKKEVLLEPNVTSPTVNEGAVTPTRKNSFGQMKGSLPIIKPSPKETSPKNKRILNPPSNISQIEANNAAVSSTTLIKDKDIIAKSSTVARDLTAEASQTESLPSPTLTDTIANMQEGGGETIGIQSPSEERTLKSSPPATEAGASSHKNRPAAPGIITCPAIARTTKSTPRTPASVTVDAKENVSKSSDNANLAQPQTVFMGSDAVDGANVKSKISVITDASETETRALCPLEKAPSAVSKQDSSLLNIVCPGEVSVFSGIEFPLITDKENKINSDKLKTRTPSAASKPADDSLPVLQNEARVNETNKVEDDESVVNFVAKPTCVKELVEKWEKVIESAEKVALVSNESIQQDIEVDELPGIEYSLSRLEEDVAATAAATEDEEDTEEGPEISTKEAISRVVWTNNIFTGKSKQVRELDGTKESSIPDAPVVCPETDVVGVKDYRNVATLPDDADGSSEGFEYTLASVENDTVIEPSDRVIKSGNALGNVQDSSMEMPAAVDDETGIEYTLHSHERFAGPSQERKELHEPLDVDDDVSEEETNEEESDNDEITVPDCVSKSPPRKRLPSRMILVKTPKRISSLWQKRQKKDTADHAETKRAGEKLETPIEASRGICVQERSDESVSVRSKDTGMKTPSVSVDETASVDKDNLKKDQPVPESPLSVTDIILEMTEMELLASGSQDISTDTSSRVTESDQPESFLITSNGDIVDVASDVAKQESASLATKEIEIAPRSPPKTRRVLSLFRRRSYNFKPMEEPIIEELESVAGKDNDSLSLSDDEAILLSDKTSAILRERSNESLLSEQAVPESTMYGMVEKSGTPVMDVILGEAATEPPSPDKIVTEVKISVLDQSASTVATDAEKLDKGMILETKEKESGKPTDDNDDISPTGDSTGPLPWLQILPDEGIADECEVESKGDEELEGDDVDREEKMERDDEEPSSEAKAGKQDNGKRSFWKRRKSAKKETETKLEGEEATAPIEEKKGEFDASDDVSAEASDAPTTKSADEPYTGPMPWEAVATEAAEAAKSASSWVSSALGITEDEKSSGGSIETSGIPDTSVVKSERDGDKSSTAKGRTFRMRSFGRSRSSISAEKGPLNEYEVPLDDGLKASSRSFTRRSCDSNLDPEDITRSTGSSATQKRDNRGIGRMFAGRRSRSKDSPSCREDASTEPLLPGEEGYDTFKMKKKRTKIKLHRKKYTGLDDDDESKKEVADENFETRITTPTNCHDCSSCLPGVLSA